MTRAFPAAVNRHRYGLRGKLCRGLRSRCA